MRITWCNVAIAVLLLLQFWPIYSKGAEAEAKPGRYQIASFDWDEVNVPYVIAIWLLVASIAKILFHVWPKVSEMFPDSSLLIMIGLGAGIVLELCGVDRDKFYLGSKTFFLYLLPPLVFDAGYNMPARQFFDNLGSVLAFALLGTLFNFVAMGISLWAIGLTGVFGVEMPLLHYLVFAALIVDVDPVAVIVIFEEMQVNEDLFIAVFGESLLNDGISVVVYKMMLTFAEIYDDDNDRLQVRDYFYGVISFLVISFGGLGIGLFFGYLTSFITKYTSNVKILNPVFVLAFPFCAYLTCEMFGLSSIIGIVFCAAALRPYVGENIPEKAYSAINYFVKVLSLASETVIFVFLGLSTVSSEHHWNGAFIVTTVTLCILYRTLGVTVLCSCLNKRRLNKYSKIDQFIIAYGGLRGAIAYGLVVALPDSLPGKRLFVTSCIVVIYWTVFLQGLTLKPIASFLEVERKKVYRKNMIDHIYENLVDYTMAGMEDIAGMRGHASLRIAYEKFNRRFLKPWLIKRDKRQSLDNTTLTRKYKKIFEREAKRVMTELLEARSRGATMETVFAGHMTINPASEYKFDDDPEYEPNEGPSSSVEGGAPEVQTLSVPTRPSNGYHWTT